MTVAVKAEIRFRITIRPTLLCTEKDLIIHAYEWTLGHEVEAGLIKPVEALCGSRNQVGPMIHDDKDSYEAMWGPLDKNVTWCKKCQQLKREGGNR